MSFKKRFASAFCFSAFWAATASAQLPAGSFGIGANITAGSPGAQLLYAVHPAFQLSLSADYLASANTTNTSGQSTTMESDNSSYTIGVGGKFFFRPVGILPFVNVNVLYSATPKSTQIYYQSSRTDESQSIGANVEIGAQYFFTPSFAVHGQFGAGVFKGTQKTKDIYSPDLPIAPQSQETDFTRFSFGNPSLGVSFFF